MKVFHQILQLQWNHLPEIINTMYLYGASGHAKVIIDILKANKITIDGLFDDNNSIKDLLDYPVFPSSNAIGPLIISIGNNQIRSNIVKKLSDINYEIAQHPSAIISEYATLDTGTVVMQGVIIQSCSHVGKHCIINTGASVDHDCIIEDFVHISPHSTLCGNVIVGEGSWIGAGSTILPGIKIGKWCIVGAGSVVAKDLPDNVLAVGNR